MNSYARAGVVYSLVAMAVSAANTLAASGENGIPYTNTFEAYDAGYAIVNEAGWGVAYDRTNDAVVILSESWSSNHPSTFLPLEPHSKVLSISGVVSNSYTQIDTPVSLTNFITYIDFTIKPERRSSPPDLAIRGDPSLAAYGYGLQVAAYINEDGNIVFYHGWWDNYFYQKWSTNNIPEQVIPSNDWVRLTLAIAYHATAVYYPEDDLWLEWGDAFYRIQVNGSTNYYMNEYGYRDPWTWFYAPDGGSWFRCPNSNGDGNARHLSSLSIEGFAQLDDLVVSTNPPPPVQLPAGFTQHGTPYSWLEAHGLTEGGYEAADVYDYDKDGKTAWEEYWSGTDPKDKASVLAIVSVAIRGATNVVTWLGGTNETNPNWLIFRSTNLMGTVESTWTSLPSTNYPRIPDSEDGTNVWSDPDANLYLPRVFYRIATPTNSP